ncbi:MAG TPA: VWA domain-containing protein [Pyrinomonadaceae bacterium]|jgi:Ca-activated chloride channel family protein
MAVITPTVEFITERPRLVADREQTVDVLVRITPPAVPTAVDARRPPLNLSLVLDRSGSMGGEKMARAREAAQFCVEQLLPTDRISVVLFDDRIELLIPSQPAADKARLQALLAEVFARGTTALHEAWVRGGIQVSEHLDERAINRVLLITDGLANVGETNPDRIVDQARGLAARGVSTSTIGIGADFNEDLLVPMAQAAGGNAWHVERPEDMQRIFATELEGLVAQFAHTVTLGLVPSDGVKLSDLLNDFELTETGRYRLPNLQVGAPLDVVARLRVPAGPAGTERHLLDLKLGYTPQDARAAEVVKQSFVLRCAPEAEVQALPVNEEAARAVQFLMNARARREAIRHMDAGDFGSARATIRGARAATMALHASAPAAAAPQYDEEMAALQQADAALDDPGEVAISRKRLSYQDYFRRFGKRSK